MNVLRWIFSWRLAAAIQIIGVFAMLVQFAPELPILGRIAMTIWYAVPLWLGQRYLADWEAKRKEQRRMLERACLLPKGR